MPKGKGIYDEEGADKDQPGRPASEPRPNEPGGPSEQRSEDDAAPREEAPDVDESGEEPTG